MELIEADPVLCDLRIQEFESSYNETGGKSPMSLHSHLLAIISFNLKVFWLHKIIFFLHFQCHQNKFEEVGDTLPGSSLWALQQEREEEVEPIISIPRIQEFCSKVSSRIILHRLD